MQMTVDDFFSKLFKLYPLDSRNGSAWMAEYRKVITDETALEETWDILIRTYSGVSAPKPAWFQSNSVSKKQIEQQEKLKNSPDYIEFPSLWAQKDGHWYEFGVEPEVGISVTVRALSKQGFINITNQNPYLQKYEAQNAVCS